MISQLLDLEPGQVVYVDFHDTLFFIDTQTANVPLIEALKLAQFKGVKIHLWTHADFKEAVERVVQMRLHGLVFDDVHCAVSKGDLIIDNLAFRP